MKEFINNIEYNFREIFSSPINILTSVIDIVLVAVLLFGIFMFLYKHSAKRLIKIVIIVVVIVSFLSSSIFDNRVSSSIAANAFLFLSFALILLFTQDLKRSLFKLSSPKSSGEIFTTEYDVPDEELKSTIDEIVRAAQNMSKKDVGALMIIAPHDVPQNILDSGTKLDAVLSSALLESVFHSKSPLHDGAVFIRGNRIVASGCFLPLTQSIELDKELGTRHRAAIGVTETNNMLAIIVSEETGIISVAMGGVIHRFFDSEMLADKLAQVYGLKALEGVGNKKFRRRK
ncbi:MAG: diadenylate cyclase [Firmicutes bacterium]|nr:diadenylate cyclase [Bacillota bacterium]